MSKMKVRVELDGFGESNEFSSALCKQIIVLDKMIKKGEITKVEAVLDVIQGITQKHLEFSGDLPKPFYTDESDTPTYIHY